MTNPPEIPTIAPASFVPERKTPGAAGADLRAHTDQPVMVPPAPGVPVSVPTGVRVAIPEGFFGMLALRSSLGRRGLTIPNGVGVIDSDYRGEVMMTLANLTGSPVVVQPGERVGQLVLIPCMSAQFVPVESLDYTERGEGGFGSTGTH